MGGCVGVIIKKEDGEVIPMNRWTNVMPGHFKNIDLYLGNTEKWYEEFSKGWQNMKTDYEKNQFTGQYEHAMTGVYFPHNTCSPCEYGIIVVDLQNKKIYSSQDYCAIGEISLHNLYSFNDPVLDQDLLKKYYDHGFLKEITYYDKNKKEHLTLNVSELNFEELVQFFDEIKDNRHNWLEENQEKSYFNNAALVHLDKNNFDIYSVGLKIDSDWKITSYHDRSIGLLKVKKLLENDGFTFTVEDNNAWKDYLSYTWYDENEDDLKDDKDYQEFKNLYQELFNENFVIQKDIPIENNIGYVTIENDGDSIKFIPK